MSDKTNAIRWYQTELEIKNDPVIQIPVSIDRIDADRKANKRTVPEDRLLVIARSRKSTESAKALLLAQAGLSKSNVIIVANKFLTTAIEESLESSDMVLNILDLVGRRVGKKRF